MRHVFVRALCALAAVTAVALAPAPARAATSTSTFASVDAIRGDSTILSLTGVRVGENAPVTLHLQVSTSSALRAECQRLALVAQAKPGAYLLVVEHSAPDAYGRAYLSACTIARADP
jgi:hypothetical protein